MSKTHSPMPKQTLFSLRFPAPRTRWAILLLFLALLPQAALAQTDEVHQLADDLEVRRLGEGVWLHTTWRDLGGASLFPSNGLIVVSEKKALLIDTAWGDTLTETLLHWIDAELGASVESAVLTHAHDDRMIGIGVLKQAGVTSYALPQTVEGAAHQQWPLPDSVLAPAQHLAVGIRTVETFFPGPGHTVDNLAVWLPEEKLLFGGCMVRAAGARSMGNVADADVEAWPHSISNLLSRYADVQTVVPSHGPVGDHGLLEHTLDLLKEHTEKKAGG